MISLSDIKNYSNCKSICLKQNHTLKEVYKYGTALQHNYFGPKHKREIFKVKIHIDNIFGIVGCYKLSCSEFEVVEKC
jgi:hypothetical protein